MLINFLIALIITWLVGWGAFPSRGGIFHLLLVMSVASLILHAFPLKEDAFRRSIRNGTIR